MVVHAQLHDGTILEFPDGTPDTVVDSTVQQHLGVSPPPDTSLTDQAEHYAGLGGRALLQGAAAIPALAGDVGTAAVNGAIYGINKYKGTSSPYQELPTSYMGQSLTRMGVAAPQNAGENAAVDLGSALTGTAGMIGVGKELAAGGASRIGALLSARPAAQYASAAGGSLAGSAAQADGATPGEQIAATLAGGFLPAIGSGAGNMVKLAARGGDANLPAMQANIRAFNGAGVTPSLGQATEGSRQQWLESLIGKLPGSGSVIKDFAQDQTTGLGQHAADLADGLAAGSTPTTAGTAITNGIKDDFLPAQRQIQKALYDQIDQHLPPSTQVPAANTASALKTLTQPIAGAPALSNSSLLSNSVVDQLKSAMQSDMGGSPAQTSPILNSSGQPFTTPATQGNNTLPYQALKDVRTRIGEKLTSGDLTPDVSKTELKRIYGGLSQDMQGAAQAAGPAAESAFNTANQFTKDLHAKTDVLNGIVNASSPEASFRSALAESPYGGTKIGTVMDALPDAGKKEVAATVIRNMGRATAGNQNSEGDLFSGNSFLTNWNKISPDAKSALFDNSAVSGSVGPQMKNLAGVLSNLKDGSKILANPSGTGAVNASVGAATLLANALLHGKLGEAATIAATVPASKAVAQKLVNPDFVNRMAQPMNSLAPGMAGVAQALQNH